MEKHPESVPGETLAEWFARTGHTLTWLANKLGITVATMSRITRGITMPRARTALRIEQETGVTIETMARTKAALTPFNRAAKIRHAKQLIDRGTAMLEHINEVA